MRARRLTFLRRTVFATAVACATAMFAGCIQSSPAPVSSGSTTGPSTRAADRRDAELLTLRDDLNSGGLGFRREEVTKSGPVGETITLEPVADAQTAEPAPNPVPTSPPAEAVIVADVADEPAGESPTQAVFPPREGWPNFRNGADLRGIAGTTLPENLELLWKLETHDGVTATAAIDDGRVFVAELSGNIRCLDLHTGQEYWHYRTIENEDPEEFAPGFNAPVTLSATAVFVGDEEGTLHAVDRESGRLLWKVDSEGEIKGGATLLPPDAATGTPRVMFGSHDGKLYCLNAATGEQLWAFDTLGPVNGSQALTAGGDEPSRVTGSQALAGQFTFVAGCDKPFLRVVDVASGQQHAEIPLESLLIASPALIGNVLYFGTPDGEVIALDWTTQKQEWLYADTQRQQEIHSSPAVTDTLVLIGSRDKRLHAIDRLTGKAAWTFETRGPVDSSPVVVGERIFFGSADRHVYGVDFSGTEVWKYNSGRRISASPAVGDGHLIIGCEGPDGPVLCFGSMQ